MTISRREKLLGGLKLNELTGVEIGALATPFVRREDGEVLYVDHADTETLAEKYRHDPSVNIDNIVQVDAIWGDNTLGDAVKGRKVDYVVASHVIEHVPDLITWLAEIASILHEDGSLRLIVPDRRFTFDYLRQETRVCDVLNSYLARARRPQPALVLDYVLNTAVVDLNVAWEGNINPEKLQEQTRPAEDAMTIALDVMQNHSYVDVHCWVFTPKSFSRLMRQLAEIGLLDFACERFYDTERGYFDFFVTLQPSNDLPYILQSWRDMELSAADHATENGSATAIQTEKERSLANHIDSLTGQLDLLKKKLSESCSRVADLESPTSWKITSPLRAAVSLVRPRN